MRRAVIILLGLALAGTHLHASEARFRGGPADGYAAAITLGSAEQELVLSARFRGGSADGSSIAIMSGDPVYQEIVSRRFLGGSNDGSAVAVALREPGAYDFNRFGGGSADGYSSIQLILPLPAHSGARFLGAAGDGYDSTAIGGYPNPLNRDTDGDGLPDWWEMEYFQRLIATAPADDFDGDGAVNLSEFLADTNPIDANSALRITRLTFDPPVTISVTCSPRRSYTLYSAGTLQGPWLKVPGQENLPGDFSGVLHLRATNTISSCFYKVECR